ncbi:MAG: coenzyme F420-0:L-glutamate ligase [Candidatus Bathyarchaeia archaeon]
MNLGSKGLVLIVALKDLLRMYEVIPVKTRFWKPGDDYLNLIVNAVNGKLKDGDFLTVSEKALSTSLGNLVDESRVKPTLLSKFIVRIWVRYFWAYFLGKLCHLRERTLERLRRYPIVEGSTHKQVALRMFGLLNALMFASEGGIDGSNVPAAYVSLPLKSPSSVAEEIRSSIEENLKKKVTVIIVDTDKTYSYYGFNFTPRSSSVSGIHSLGGFISYVAGRALRLRMRATPVGLSGGEIDVEETLNIADLANRFRGHGAGRTVWDMAERFGVPVDAVSWSMLESVEHTPIVIVRRSKQRIK